MKNPLVDILFNEEGQLRMDKARFIAPHGISATEEEVKSHIFAILSSTALPTDFIMDHFDELEMQLVLTNNVVHESKLVDNIGKVIGYIAEELLENPDQSYLLSYIFAHQTYSPSFYDTVTASVLERIALATENGIVTEEHGEKATTNVIAFINSYMIKFSKSYVIESGHFYLISSFVQRTDITPDDLRENIDSIKMEEILVFLSGFCELEGKPEERHYQEEGYTRENELLIRGLASLKLETEKI